MKTEVMLILFFCAMILPHPIAFGTKGSSSIEPIQKSQSAEQNQVISENDSFLNEIEKIFGLQIKPQVDHATANFSQQTKQADYCAPFYGMAESAARSKTKISLNLLGFYQTYPIPKQCLPPDQYIKQKQSLIPALPYAAPKPFIIAVEEGPPPGFEFLDRPQVTVVDVYYSDRNLGSFRATYTANTIQFQNPTKIVEQLEDVSNKPGLIRTLSGALNSHANLACQTRASKDCGFLESGQTGVIFNPSNYRVDLFLGPTYKTKAPGTVIFLPPSEIKHSYNNTLNAIVSGNNGNSSYNITNDNVLAYKNFHFNVFTSYNGNLSSEEDEGITDGGISDLGDEDRIKRFQITEINGNLYKNNCVYRAGYIRNLGNIFIPDQDILGAFAGTTLDHLEDSRTAYGSPIFVFLSVPSQVEIFREGRLISSKFYPAGNQRIDTSGLPRGAYQITLVIRSRQGRVERERRFFVKTSDIPPEGYPQYYVSAGLWEGQTSQIDILPETSDIPLYQVGGSKRVSPSLGINGSILGTDKHLFGTTGVFYQGKGYNFEPQILAGTDGDFGVAVQLELYFEKLSGTLTGRRIWGKSDPNQFLTIGETTFDPFTQSQTQITLSTTYRIKDSLLTFDANYSKTADNEAIYSYGPTLRVPLFNRNKLAVWLELQAADSESQYLLRGKLEFNYFAPTVSHTLDVGYREIRNKEKEENQGSDVEQPSLTGLVIDGTSQWRKFNAAQEGLELNALYSKDIEDQSIGASTRMTGTYGRAEAEIQRNSSPTTDTTYLYNGRVTSHLVVAGKKIAIGGKDRINSGVVIDIETPKQGDKFEVYINAGVRKIVSTDRPTPIVLRPFERYKIRIKAVSQTFYHYDERPRTVVLWPGNWQKLTWEARQKYIIFMKILQPDGKPLSNSVVRGGVDFNATGDDGYLQGEIFDDAKKLEATLDDGRPCTITLPSVITPKEGVAELKDTVCIPVPGSKPTIVIIPSEAAPEDVAKKEIKEAILKPGESFITEILSSIKVTPKPKPLKSFIPSIKPKKKRRAQKEESNTKKTDAKQKENDTNKTDAKQEKNDTNKTDVKQEKNDTNKTDDQQK